MVQGLAERGFSGFRTAAGWYDSVTNWALESFMDEAALMVRADPVAFRIGLLDGAGRNAGSGPNAVGGAKRQAAVLKRAAEKAGWGAAMPRDTGLGVATTFGQERGMPHGLLASPRSFIQTARLRKSKVVPSGA